MSSETASTHRPSYVAVFGALIALTVITVGVSRIHLGHAGNTVLALVVAGIKACIVAAYFMHLKFETKHLVLAVTVPLVLVLVFLAGLMPDITFR